MNVTALATHAGALIAALSLSACLGNYSTANIADAWLTADPDDGTPTTVFSQDATIYGVVDLRNAPDTTVVKAAWIAVDTEAAEPGYLITEAELETGSAILYFEATPPVTAWPLGSYKADLYLNEELDRTLEYEVQ